MTETEFDQWLDAHSTAFPSIGEWFARLATAKETRNHWRRALANTEHRDALAVTEAMAIGEIEAPLQWEQRDQTAIIVRREASRIRGKRNKQATTDLARPRPSRHGGTLTPLRTLLSRALSFDCDNRAGRLSDDDHALHMEQLRHEAKSGACEPRAIKCMDCSDTGIVLCWHTASIRVLRLSGSLPIEKRAVMATVCGMCEKGRGFIWPSSDNDERKAPVQYRKRSHCRLVSGCGQPDASDFVELQRWLAEDYLTPALAGDFADFNAGDDSDF